MMVEELTLMAMSGVTGMTDIAVGWHQVNYN
jgi:hypothetical protein